MAEQDKKDQQQKKGGKPSAEEIAAKKAAKAKQKAAQTEETGADEGPSVPAPPPRLIAHYREKVVPALRQRFGYKNALAVPRLEKIVISMGLGKAVTGGEKGKLEQAEKELSVIAGQKPQRCKAKKSVANFKVREGMETGLKVTLRGARMYEFLDRLIALAIPRVKDFRGLAPNGFDKNGNYNFGFTEQTVFPEVDAAAVTFQQGMNVTMVTTARSPDEGRELLKSFGFPFREDSGGKKEGK
jgi:large subunit ribosomal protein L5